jgi:hypothetical protein
MAIGQFDSAGPSSKVNGTEVTFGPMVLLAAAFIGVSLLLPVASIVGLAGGSTHSFTGAELADWTGWTALVMFTCAGGVRFTSPLVQYKNLLDILALASIVLAVSYSLLATPYAKAISENNRHEAARSTDVEMWNGYHNNVPRRFESFEPEYGAGFVVLAPALLLFARRRERNAVAI